MQQLSTGHAALHRRPRLPRYTQPIERKPFVTPKPVENDAVALASIHQMYKLLFVGDLQDARHFPMHLPLRERFVSQSESSNSQKRSRWESALDFLTAYAPSLPSRRFMLAQWIPHFVSDCFAKERADMAVQKISAVLRTFPDRLFTAPLLECVVTALERAAQWKPQQKAIEAQILTPIREKLSEKCRITPGGSFDLNERLIRAPALLLRLWGSVRISKASDLPKCLPTLLHALWRYNAQLYSLLYCDAFDSRTPALPLTTDQIILEKPIASVARELAKLSTILSDMHSSVSLLSVFKTSTNTAALEDRSCFFLAHAIARFPGGYWQTAMQIYGEQAAERRQSPGLHALLLCAAVVQVTPAAEWMRVLRMFFYQNRNSLSDTEIAAQLYPKVAASKRVGWHLAAEKKRNPFDYAAGEFDFLLLHLRKKLENSKNGKLLGLKPTAEDFLPTEGEKPKSSGVIDNRLLSHAVSPRTLAKLFQEHTILAQSALKNLEDIPETKRQWVSALALLTMSSSGTSNWAEFLEVFTQYTEKFGKYHDGFVPIIANLANENGDGKLVPKPSETQASLCAASQQPPGKQIDTFFHHVNSSEHPWTRVSWPAHNIQNFGDPRAGHIPVQSKSALHSLLCLSQRFISSAHTSIATLYRKLSLAAVRLALAPDDKPTASRHLEIALPVVLNMLSSSPEALTSSWSFDLHLLNAIQRLPLCKKSNSLQQHIATKNAAQRVAELALAQGLWQTAISLTLFFQRPRRSLTRANGRLKTVFIFPLSISDHSIVKQSVERKLRELFEKSTAADSTTDWQTTLRLVHRTIQPLQKRAQIMATGGTAQRVPVEYFSFATCCLRHWALAHVPNHRAFFQLLAAISPLRADVIRPYGSFPLFPTRDAPWKILCTVQPDDRETNCEVRRDAASVHFFTFLQWCVTHGRLWQRAFGALLAAVKLEKIALSEKKDHAAKFEDRMAYGDLLGAAFGMHGPSMTKCIAESESCAAHSAVAPLSPFCTTLLHLCRVHSVDMTCTSVLPVLLPLLQPYAPPEVFFDSLLETIAKTVTLHQRTQKGVQMLRRIEALVQRDLPINFGYILRKHAAAAIGKSISLWNAPTAPTQRFRFFFEATHWGADVTQLDALAYQWSTAIAHYQRSMHSCSDFADIDARQRRAGAVLSQLVAALRPSLNADLAVPAEIILKVMYVHFLSCHAIPAHALSKLCVLLSASQSALSRESLQRQQKSKEASLATVNALCRLQIDVKTAYHVKAVVYSLKRKRIDVDALVGLNPQACLQGISGGKAEKEVRHGNGRLVMGIEAFSRHYAWCEERESQKCTRRGAIGLRQFLTVSAQERALRPTLWLSSHSQSQFSPHQKECSLASSDLSPNRKESAQFTPNDQIFYRLCTFVASGGAQQSTSPAASSDRLSLSPAVALAYASLHGQLHWQTLHHDIFHSDTAEWKKALSAARLLCIDLTPRNRRS